MMSLKSTISILTLLGLATVAIASEEMRSKLAIAVIEDGGDELRLDLDSEDFGFNLHDMQLGENYAFVDEAGRNVLVTRTEAGFDFSIDGKSISMPAPGADGRELAWIGEGEGGEIDVHVLCDVEVSEAAHDGEHKVHVIKKVVKVEED